MSRQRTPPALKWALNHRAALVGHIDRLSEQLRVLQERRNALQAQVAAVDRTIQLLDTRVAPDSLATVSAWKGRYGRRGALKELLEELLRAAGSEGLSTSQLGEAAIRTFGLEFATSEAREAFVHNSVRNQLRVFRERGVVEALERTDTLGAPRAWRWRDAPSLAALAQATERS